MFERFKRHGGDGDGSRDAGGVATAERPATASDADAGTTADAGTATGADGPTTTKRGRFVRDGGTTGPGTTGLVSRETVRAVRARQHAEYGGMNWGAAFFGFLVAVGLVGGILLAAVVAIAYWFAGYVSGRMSRFDGARQGLGSWAIGLLVTIALGIAGWFFGPDWNVFDKLGLPNVPIDNGTLTVGAAITGVIVLVLSLLAAMAGGKVGERYHRKIDRLRSEEH